MSLNYSTVCYIDHVKVLSIITDLCKSTNFTSVTLAIGMRWRQHAKHGGGPRMSVVTRHSSLATRNF